MNGVNTVSPLLLHRAMHRSITPNCNGQMCFSSADSRAPLKSFNTSVLLMSIHTGLAHFCHVSKSKLVLFSSLTGSQSSSLPSHFLKIVIYSGHPIPE